MRAPSWFLDFFGFCCSACEAIDGRFWRVVVGFGLYC